MRYSFYHAALSCFFFVFFSSDISRNEEQLNELKMYRQFLYNLAPQEWREKHHELTQKHSNGSASEAATEEVRCTAVIIDLPHEWCTCF